MFGVHEVPPFIEELLSIAPADPAKGAFLMARPAPYTAARQDEM